MLQVRWPFLSVSHKISWKGRLLICGRARTTRNKKEDCFFLFKTKNETLEGLFHILALFQRKGRKGTGRRRESSQRNKRWTRRNEKGQQKRSLTFRDTSRVFEFHLIFIGFSIHVHNHATKTKNKKDPLHSPTPSSPPRLGEREQEGKERGHVKSPPLFCRHPEITRLRRRRGRRSLY